MLVLVPVVISNGLRTVPQGDNLGMFTSHWPTERLACIFIFIQQSFRSVKSMNPKNTKYKKITDS